MYVWISEKQRGADSINECGNGGDEAGAVSRDAERKVDAHTKGWHESKN
jgi:hypothetical protein